MVRTSTPFEIDLSGKVAHAGEDPELGIREDRGELVYGPDSVRRRSQVTVPSTTCRSAPDD